MIAIYCQFYWASTNNKDFGIIFSSIVVFQLPDSLSVSWITGALTHRSLGQVRLRELPKWLACKAPSHPKDAVGMLQRGQYLSLTQRDTVFVLLTAQKPPSHLFVCHF